MAPHSSTLAWKIPWMEEPGRLQPMGSLESDTTERLHFHFSLSCTGGGNGNPLQCSCLENPRDDGAWWAAIYGVAQSWTWLKRLSSSSSSRGPYFGVFKKIPTCLKFFAIEFLKRTGKKVNLNFFSRMQSYRKANAFIIILHPPNYTRPVRTCIILPRDWSQMKEIRMNSSEWR